MKNMVRKVLLMTLCLSILIPTLLFAGGQTEKEADEIVTITVWDWFHGSAGAQGEFAKYVDIAFQEKYPNIRVNHETVSHPPYGVYAASMAAKEGADVILVHANGQNFQDMADSLVILDDYIGDVKNQFPESTLADTSPDRDISKGIRGLPVTVQGWVWYYNKELFVKAGLDPENPPESWDDFLAACESLQNAGIIPVGFGEGIHLEMMIAGTMDQVLSLEEKRRLLSGEMKFTDPKITNVFAKFQSLFQDGYMDKAGLTTPLLREMGERFMAGGSAIFRGFVSDIFNWYEFGNALGGENLGVITNFYFIPSAHQDVAGVAGGVAYAVPTYSKNQEAAIKYVKFTASEEAANILLSKTGGVPANLNANKSLLANAAGQQVMDIIATSIVPPSKAFIQTAQWVTLRGHAPLLITGELTPEEFGQVIDDARE
ncbi:MAG: extracellular solute-binding protein [Bacteroidetes bacterium]|nr:extracellular solute-binding protein [Bacteroidota bacterium]